jgi:predicted kinase
MYRVELITRASKKKPKGNYIMTIDPDFDALINAASNKLRIPLKKLKLYVHRSVLHSSGTEVTSEMDIDALLKGNQTVLTGTKGLPYHGKTKDGLVTGSKRYKDLMNKIPHPPRYPYFLLKKEDDAIRDRSKMSDQSPPSIETVDLNGRLISDTEISQTYDSKNSFPVLEGDVLNLFRNAMRGSPNITETNHDDYTIFDYKDRVAYSSDAFERSIQKECRGIVISLKTGKVLARRFHKFYNIGECEEAMPSSIDFHSGIRVYEKMDGSLVSPILLESGDLIWATRRNRSGDVEDLAKQTPLINEFSRSMLSQNITPLFEYCVSADAPGLAYYDKNKLVLLALRHNVSGSYIPFDSLEESYRNRIEIVEEQFYDSYEQMTKYIDRLTDTEGVVLYLPNGDMFKLKTSWWVSITRANKQGGVKGFLPEVLKITGTLRSIPAEKVWLTALQNNDDIVGKSTVLIKDPDEQRRFIQFVEIVRETVQKLKDDIILWAKDAYATIHNKEPIISVGNAAGLTSKIVNDALTTDSVNEELMHVLFKLAKKRMTSNLEEILDVAWNSIDASYWVSDSVLDICEFDSCSKDLADHVLDTYLPRKLSQLLGMRKVSPDIVVNLSRNYRPDEGKIIGMYEQFTKNDIWDLRIDLQPSLKSGYTAHYGSPEYALLLVQYGLPNNPDSHPHGEFAGVLIPTESACTVEEITDAMRRSFEMKRIVKLRRRIRRNGMSKIFCDLDGVLADFEKGVVRVTGRKTTEQTRSKMWSRILSHPGFFASLEWMEDGDELWDFIEEYRPTILTGITSSCKKAVVRDKIKWCGKNLGPEIDVITCNSSDKHRYAGYGNILIDDRIENKKMWEAFGGVFIHHSNAARTVYELKRHFGMIRKADPPYPISSMNINQNIPFYTLSQKVENVITYLPPIEDAIVGIDVEWESTDATNPISTVQIVTRTHAYVVDMLNATDIVKESVVELLVNDRVTKLFFDASNQDIMRLQSDIINVIDFREWAVDNLNPAWSGSFPSLNTLCKIVLNHQLRKEMQMSSWDIRPLSMEQLEYAAADAGCLIDIYDRVLALTNLTTRNIYLKTQSKKTLSVGKDEYDPSIPTIVIYAGIFLTPRSKELLIERFPAKFPKIYADHITLMFEPSEYDLRGFPIERQVGITITGVHEDSNLQSVRVRIDTQSDEENHITISTNVSVLPKESNDITSYRDCDPLVITGLYGVLVTYEDNPLVIFSEKTRNRITEFAESAQPGESIRFKPNELSSAERSVIHEYANENNMKSESSGKKESRRLILTKLRERGYGPSSLPIYEHPDDLKAKEKKKRLTHKITDRNMFESINLVSDGRSILTAGTAESNGIRWNRSFDADGRVARIIDDLGSTNIMVIMRGLPGSGKSSLARILARNLSPNLICSADSYFETKDGYQFSKDRLSAAHAACLERAEDIVSYGGTVIIDNTNSRRSEYQKYIDLADENNYDIYIIEIACRDREQVRIFSERTTHMVPHKNLIQMLMRWETDDDAVIILPFCDTVLKYLDTDQNIILNEKNIDASSISFQRWLSDNRMFHSNKKRNKTHLLMAVGDRSNMYIDVSPRMIRQFLEAYSRSGLSESDEPKYLVELPGSRFRMFFDIDFDHVVDDSLIVRICRIVQKVLESDIYVMGFNEGHTGVHLKCYDHITNYEEAIQIHRQVVEYLQAESELDRYNWDAIVDSSVYIHGLRMLGSRKVTKLIDHGRIYRMMFVVNEDGEICETDLDNADLLERLSIHV